MLTPRIDTLYVAFLISSSRQQPSGASPSHSWCATADRFARFQPPPPPLRLSVMSDDVLLMMRAINDTVGELIKWAQSPAAARGDVIDVRRIKNACAARVGVNRSPKLVDILAALPEAWRKRLTPLLTAKPIRSASGISVVAVMCKPHRSVWHTQRSASFTRGRCAQLACLCHRRCTQVPSHRHDRQHLRLLVSCALLLAVVGCDLRCLSQLNAHPFRSARMQPRWSRLGLRVLDASLHRIW